MKTKLNFLKEQYNALSWTSHSPLTHFVQVHSEVYVLLPQHDKRLYKHVPYYAELPAKYLRA